MLAGIRAKYWSFYGRNIARQTTQKCFKYFRSIPYVIQPIMRNLPLRYESNLQNRSQNLVTILLNRFRKKHFNVVMHVPLRHMHVYMQVFCYQGGSYRHYRKFDNTIVFKRVKKILW